ASTRPAPAARTAPAAPSKTMAPSAAPASGGSFKDAFLAGIRSGRQAFYSMTVAQAQKIEFAGDTVTFTFSPSQRTLKDNVDKNRAWLEDLARQTAGRKISIVAVQTDVPPAAKPEAQAAQPAADDKSSLREQAMADSGVQALLEVFPAEIRDVEEM